MARRTIGIWMLALGCLCFAATAVSAADEPSHEGTVVSAGNGKLTMTNKGDGKQHTHDVADSAKITINGMEAKLNELKEGMAVTVTTTKDMKTATKIEATTAKKPS